jgi:hypothetical protein
VVAKNTPGDFERCFVQLSVKGITAEEFLKWFHTRCAKNVASMQAAQPEHWVVTTDSTGSQMVTENLGPTIARFQIEFAPPEQQFQKEDLMDDFPIKMSGKGKFGNDTVQAYVLHQFRPHATGVGFDANLRAYFPKAAGEELIEQHRQHLVVEFTNWTRNCYTELKVEGVQL